jgi:hypothetical protein
MPFAEPRPHRRPFHAFKTTMPLTVTAKHKNVNLALTSITVSNQSDKEKFVQVISRGGTGDIILLMVLVRGVQTLHFPFPHPIMVGEHRKLVVKDMAPNGALFPVTVVGYEWRSKDDD